MTPDLVETRIGAPELITVWKDLVIDAKLRTFYYARVMEIPTPRWTAYSPIWYNPST